jgi:hypothetical protein
MIQKLAWTFGIVFIIIGILGFVPSLTSGGLLFGVFSVDVMHNIVHLASGILAILAVRSGARYTLLYFKVFGIVYAIVTVLGFLEGDTILGLMTINMADNVLHLVIAVVALWAGFGAKTDARVQPGMAM